MEGHVSVMEALQNLPGIDMRIDGLHDVPRRVLQVLANVHLAAFHLPV